MFRLLPFALVVLGILPFVSGAGCNRQPVAEESAPATAQAEKPRPQPPAEQPPARAPGEPAPVPGKGVEPPPAPPPAQAPPPTVRAAECRWATNRIRIDGKTDEVAWEKAQALSDFTVSWQNRKPKTATTARLLWDNQYLYFTADMEDTDLYADVTQRNGMTWTNDVFELFFKPATDKLAYYEFQVNAANTQLELFFPSRGSGGYQRFAPLTDLGMESAVKLRGTLNNWKDKDEGWTVEGRIPWKAFAATGGKPNAGDKWRFSLCRYDYSVGFEQPELSTTSPLTRSDFHRYEDYGELTFVGPPD